VEGVDSTQNAELRAAKKRIKALEEEVQLVREASALFDSVAVVDPKEHRPSQNNSRRPDIPSGKPPGCVV